MTELPTPARRGIVTETDIQTAFAGIEPGWYKTADLLPRYNAWAEANGKPVVTTKALGETIKREFTPKRRNAHGNVAVWYLDEATLNHRGWFRSDT